MRKHLHLALSFVLLLVGLQACDSANPVAPSTSMLFISASPTQIPLRGTSTISVTGFKPDGNPLNRGTQIVFQATFGTVPRIAEVDNNGRAVTVFTSDGTLPPPTGGENPQPAKATVTASLAGSGSGGGEEGGSTGGGPTVSVDIQIGETKPLMTLSVTPVRINVEQEATVSVLARLADGSPLSGGQVRLRTTLGQLDDESLSTDANGEAMTLLRSDGRSGEAEVTGTVNNGDEVTTMATIIPSQVIVDVFPRIVDINAPSEVTIQLRDEDGIPLVEGHEVRLTANLGTLDPETVTTDSQGVGKATYTAGTRAGTDTITAFFANATPGTDTIDLRTAPASLILIADRRSIPPNQDTDVLFTATVADAQGTLVPSELVTFTVDDGIIATFSPGAVISTGQGGQATTTVTFFASQFPPGTTQFSVTAMARGDVSSSIPIDVQ